MRWINRGKRAVNQMSTEKSPRPGAVFGAAMITLLFACVAGIIAAKCLQSETFPMAASVGLAILLGIVWAFLHPLIGRLISECCIGLSTQIERVFDFKEKSSVSSNESLFIGALWPLTMLMVPFLLIVLLLGYLYRGLWD